MIIIIKTETFQKRIHTNPFEVPTLYHALNMTSQQLAVGFI